MDLKLRPGVNRGQFQARLAADLERDFPGRFRVGQPNDSEQQSRNNNLSRAYRVNLTVLAPVALFTGAFLVFSTQALSVMRRRSQFALLRVLGVERGGLLRQVLLEGASLGIIGALLGVAGGYALAARWPCAFSAATSGPATSRASSRRWCSRRWPPACSSAWDWVSRCWAAWCRPWRLPAPAPPSPSSRATTRWRWRAWRGPGPRWCACWPLPPAPSRRRYSSCPCLATSPSACS
nr:FtsX-like permease family protein [Massilia sp. Dwa41.01b]